MKIRKAAIICWAWRRCCAQGMSRSYASDSSPGTDGTNRTDGTGGPPAPRAALCSAQRSERGVSAGQCRGGRPGAARQSYDKAILLYEKIIDQGGVRNAGLYYNLANAYLLKEDIGRAILNYRRAERLDGSDLNIKKNLAFARSRRIDRVEIAAQKRVLETLFFWHYDLSLRTRFLLACSAFAALCICLTVMIWRGRGTVGSVGAVLSGVLVLCLFASILIETGHAVARLWRDHRPAKSWPARATARTIRPASRTRSTPAPSSSSSSSVPAGSTFAYRTAPTPGSPKTPASWSEHDDP